MPMPKPENLKDLSINGKTPKKMVKVKKPHKDIPNIWKDLAKIAEQNKKDKKE